MLRFGSCYLFSVVVDCARCCLCFLLMWIDIVVVSLCLITVVVVVRAVAIACCAFVVVDV